MATVYKHKTPIQIRFKDVDMMGHVNNATYHAYIELARITYFNDVLGSKVDWRKQDGVILARTEIDYKQPIFFDDKICVHTRCSKLGNKSLDLSWVIVRENAAQVGLFTEEANQQNILARGISVLVAY